VPTMGQAQGRPSSRFSEKSQDSIGLGAMEYGETRYAICIVD
jgi:hypothetical protein